MSPQINNVVASLIHHHIYHEFFTSILEVIFKINYSRITSEQTNKNILILTVKSSNYMKVLG